MIRGLYSAASAMLATARAQEVITNNIANVNTPGFKRNIPVYQSFSNILQREIDEDTGEGKAAFYKFTGIPVDYWIHAEGKDDSGYILAVVNDSIPYIARMDNGTKDEFTAGTDAPIDYDVQTSDLSPGSYGNHKSYGIFIAKLKQDADSTTEYELTFLADEGDRSRSTTTVVPAGSGYKQKRWSRLPFQMDGRNIGLRIRNNRLTDAGFRGLSFEYKKKRF